MWDLPTLLTFITSLKSKPVEQPAYPLQSPSKVQDSTHAWKIYTWPLVSDVKATQWRLCPFITIVHLKQSLASVRSLEPRQQAAFSNIIVRVSSSYSVAGVSVRNYCNLGLDCTPSDVKSYCFKPHHINLQMPKAPNLFKLFWKLYHRSRKTWREGSPVNTTQLWITLAAQLTVTCSPSS